MDTTHTAELTENFALVTLRADGAVQILHAFGCWTTFNPIANALALCSQADRRRIFVHCRLNALTGRRGSSDTLRYALTAVEMYALEGAAS